MFSILILGSLKKETKLKLKVCTIEHFFLKSHLNKKT